MGQFEIVGPGHDPVRGDTEQCSHCTRPWTVRSTNAALVQEGSFCFRCNRGVCNICTKAAVPCGELMRAIEKSLR